MHAPSVRTLMQRKSRPGFVYLRNAVIFTVGYILLDWASYIYPMGPFNITPWNPPPALAILLIMFGGLVYAPVVFFAIFAADVVTRSLPGSLSITAATSLVLAVTYCCMSRVISPLFGGEKRIGDTRQLWLFICIVAV